MIRVCVAYRGKELIWRRFVVLSPQPAILILISLPTYATHCQYMLQRIVFLLKIGYALLVPIAELRFVGVIKISPSTVVRTEVFR